MQNIKEGFFYLFKNFVPSGKTTAKYSIKSYG